MLRLLNDGRFLEAAEAGEKEGTAKALTAAAAASSYRAECQQRQGSAQAEALFEQSRRLAQRATEQDPGYAEAWLELARSRGRLLEVRRDRLPPRELLDGLEEVVSNIERARGLAPSSPEPYMARARVEAGKIAQSRAAVLGLFAVMGDRDMALANACRAVALVEPVTEPARRALIFYTVAETLWALDSKQYASAVNQLLDRARVPCGGNAICTCVQARVRKLAATADESGTGTGLQALCIGR